MELHRNVILPFARETKRKLKIEPSDLQPLPNCGHCKPLQSLRKAGCPCSWFEQCRPEFAFLGGPEVVHLCTPEVAQGVGSMSCLECVLRVAAEICRSTCCECSSTGAATGDEGARRIGYESRVHVLRLRCYPKFVYLPGVARPAFGFLRRRIYSKRQSRRCAWSVQ